MPLPPPLSVCSITSCRAPRGTLSSNISLTFSPLSLSLSLSLSRSRFLPFSFSSTIIAPSVLFPPPLLSLPSLTLSVFFPSSHISISSHSSIRRSVSGLADDRSSLCLPDWSMSAFFLSSLYRLPSFPYFSPLFAVFFFVLKNHRLQAVVSLSLPPSLYLALSSLLSPLSPLSSPVMAGCLLLFGRCLALRHLLIRPLQCFEEDIEQELCFTF